MLYDVNNYIFFKFPVYLAKKVHLNKTTGTKKFKLNPQDPFHLSSNVKLETKGGSREN